MFQQRSLGFFTLIALVIGNMMGSGAFLLPASLARYGSIGVLAWIFTTMGAVALAMLFSRLSQVIPKVGGPYAYCRAVYGDALGLQIALNYWIAIWIGNAAIVVALVAYLGFYFPALLSNHGLAFVLACGFLWLFTIINILGIKTAGVVQVITTIAKVIPLFGMVIVGCFFIHPHYVVTSFNVSHFSFWHALLGSGALTFWAFIGLESATVPAENAINPEKNIPRATFWGTVIASIIYISSTLIIMMIVPMHELARSGSPFATAASIMLGPWGGQFFDAIAIFATAGTLNGWILLQGQIAYAAAKDGLFPKPFSRLSKVGVPDVAVVVSSLLITLLLAMSYQQGSLDQFTMIVLLATLATVIPYLYTTGVEILLIYQGKMEKPSSMIPVFLRAIVSFVLITFIIMGSGKQIIYYWMFLLIVSIPFYVIVKAGSQKESRL